MVLSRGRRDLGGEGGGEKMRTVWVLVITLHTNITADPVFGTMCRHQYKYLLTIGKTSSAGWGSESEDREELELR